MDKSKLALQTFRTSTPRVIGVELDVPKLRLRYWIDGKPLDDMVKKLPAGKAWIPAVHFGEKDHEVILNPFCVSSDEAFSSGLVARGLRDLHDDAKSGGQHSFAACLTRPIAAYQGALLASELSQFLLAYRFETQDSAGKDLIERKLKQQVKTLSNDREAVKNWAPVDAAAEELAGLPTFQAELVASSADAKTEGEASEKSQVNRSQAMLLKFESEQAALKYLAHAKENLCFLSFLGPREIAQLLLLRGGKADPAASGHFPHIENVGCLSEDLQKMLETSALFKSLDLERLHSYADLRPQAVPKKDQRELSHVVESIKHGPLLVPVSDSGAANQSRASKTAEVKAIYLPASDKVLVARGSQLKLQSRSTRGQGEFFEGPTPAYFGNHIRSVFDQVRLAITPLELKNLLELLAWSQCEGNLVVASFLESVEASYSGHAIRAPYLEALLAIKALTRVAVLQFKRIEDEARAIEAQDLTLKEVGPLPSSDTGGLRRLNFIEVNELLSVLVSLED